MEKVLMTNALKSNFLLKCKSSLWNGSTPSGPFHNSSTSSKRCLSSFQATGRFLATCALFPFSTPVTTYTSLSKSEFYLTSGVWLFKLFVSPWSLDPFARRDSSPAFRSWWPILGSFPERKEGKSLLPPQLQKACYLCSSSLCMYSCRLYRTS